MDTALPTMAPPQRERLSLLATAALLTVSLIGFANVYTYSNPDSFLGLALADQGAHTLQVMICYAVDGAAVIVCGLLVSGAGLIIRRIRLF